MPKVVEVSGANVQNCCAAARKHLGIPLKTSRESFRSGGEDSLYRVHLEDGTIVECLIIPRSATKVTGVHDA